VDDLFISYRLNEHDQPRSILKGAADRDAPSFDPTSGVNLPIASLSNQNVRLVPDIPEFHSSLDLWSSESTSEDSSTSSESHEILREDTNSQEVSNDKVDSLSAAAKPQPEKRSSVSRLLYMSSRVRCGAGKRRFKEKVEAESSIPFTGVFKLRKTDSTPRAPPAAIIKVSNYEIYDE
jgi:hypothetical protein